MGRVGQHRTGRLVATPKSFSGLNETMWTMWTMIRVMTGRWEYGMSYDGIGSLGHTLLISSAMGRD